jgi:predicted metal-dependent phosphoesterase TrpH
VLKSQGVTRVRRSLERSHFLASGYIQSEPEYGDICRELHKVSPAPAYPPARRVADAVKEAGGLVVIAHPPTYFLGYDSFRMDLLREECNFDGIECAHPRIPAALTLRYRSYCSQHDLISTAGSDCHMDASVFDLPSKKDDTSESIFASHRGEPAWLDEFLERLQ